MVVGMDNLSIEHDKAELITPFYSKSMHILIISIFDEKVLQIGENSFIKDLAFWRNLAIFGVC